MSDRLRSKNTLAATWVILLFPSIEGVVLGRTVQKCSGLVLEQGKHFCVAETAPWPGHGRFQPRWIPEPGCATRLLDQQKMNRFHLIMR